MKIILTGATGVVGLEVLQQCIKHIYIHHIYCIVRNPIPRELANHPKVTEIIHKDFESWPGPQLHTLRDDGVAGCIWCLGGAITRFANFDEANKANVALPLAAAEAFAAHLTPRPSDEHKKPFRFIYMSTAGAERDEFRSLWSQAQTRKMKGAAEKALLGVAEGEGSQGMFEVYLLRLGRVLPGGQSVQNVLTESVVTSTSAERVGRCAINTVLDGRRWEKDGGTVVENGVILGDDWADINTQH